MRIKRRTRLTTSLARRQCSLGQPMVFTWYVTFEVHKRGALPKRRSPRETRTFETETQAKNFARAKSDEGLIVYAGTINPSIPRRLIPSSEISHWIEDGQDRGILDPDSEGTG